MTEEEAPKRSDTEQGAVSKKTLLEKGKATARALSGDHGPEAPPQGFVEYKEDEPFQLNEEMKRFLTIEEVTGAVYKLEIESEQRRFVKNFNAWIKAGRPRPEKVNLVPEADPVVHAIYRIKVRGIQKIYWRDERGKAHWKQEVKIPKQVRRTDPRTGAETVVDLGYRTEIEYTQNYTKELAEKLIDDALKRARNPQFAYHDGNHPWSCHPEDLLIPDFDEGLKKVTTRGYGMTPSQYGHIGPTAFGRKY